MTSSAGFIPNIKKMAVMVVAAFCILGTHSSQVYAGDKAVNFLEAVSKKLLGAAQSGSKQNLEQVILSHADLEGIGMYSLGDYAKKLPVARRPSYYRGVAKFMARYFMDQATKYQIKSASFQSPSSSVQGAVLVDSVVTLRDGSTYEVQWRLVQQNQTYKIRDVKVMGFWLVPFQRDLFNNFVNEQGGDAAGVTILVSRLNN